MERRHWILRVMDSISDPNWWDGVTLGMAVAALLFIVFLWATGQ